MNKFLFSAIAISAVLLVASANESKAGVIVAQDSAKVRHSETEGKAYKVHATVVRIYREDKKITLKHGRIKGYMPAMTMTFPISKPALLDGLEEGSGGVFTIFVYKGFPTVTAIKLTSKKNSKSSGVRPAN